MLDYALELSDGQTVLSTQVSTNAWDGKAVNPNFGDGGLRFRAVIGTSPVLAGDYTADLQDSADAATYANILGGTAQTTGPAAGTILIEGGVPSVHRRYLRFNYTVSGTLTVGTITAYLYVVK